MSRNSDATEWRWRTGTYIHAKSTTKPRDAFDRTFMQVGLVLLRLKNMKRYCSPDEECR